MSRLKYSAAKKYIVNENSEYKNRNLKRSLLYIAENGVLQKAVKEESRRWK